MSKKKGTNTLLLAGIGVGALYLLTRTTEEDGGTGGILGRLGEGVDVSGLFGALSDIVGGLFGGLTDILGITKGEPEIPGELPGAGDTPESGGGIIWPWQIPPAEDGGAEPSPETPGIWEWFTGLPEIVQNIAAVGGVAGLTYGGIKGIQLTGPLVKGVSKGAGVAAERVLGKLFTGSAAKTATTAVRAATTAASQTARYVNPKLLQQWLTHTSLGEFAGAGTRVVAKGTAKVGGRGLMRAIPIVGWGILAADLGADIARLFGADVTEWLGFSSLAEPFMGYNPLEEAIAGRSHESRPGIYWTPDLPISESRQRPESNEERLQRTEAEQIQQSLPAAGPGSYIYPAEGEKGRRQRLF